MKRIVLGISVLLMLVQNGFADMKEMEKQFNLCYNEVQKDMKGNEFICLNTIKYFKSLGTKGTPYMNEVYYKTATVYLNKDDFVKAYDYYMKSAKLGNKAAQKILNQLCKISHWLCK